MRVEEDLRERAPQRGSGSSVTPVMRERRWSGANTKAGTMSGTPDIHS